MDKIHIATEAAYKNGYKKGYEDGKLDAVAECQFFKAAAALLHNRECPVGYDCRATDCAECLNIHMEKGEKNGISVRSGHHPID